MNILPPSSGLKSTPCKIPPWSRKQVELCMAYSSTWKWMQHVPPKCQLPFNWLPSVTPQKTTPFTAFRLLPLGLLQFPSGLEWPISCLISNAWFTQLATCFYWFLISLTLQSWNMETIYSSKTSGFLCTECTTQNNAFFIATTIQTSNDYENYSSQWY
jgi:hypothetical protein